MYLKKSLARGFSLLEVKQQMLLRGWTDYEIANAVRASGVREMQRREEEEEQQRIVEEEQHNIEDWDTSIG